MAGSVRTGDLVVRDVGRMEYEAAREEQRRLVAARHAGSEPDTLLVVEHEPVITVGRGTRGAFLSRADTRLPAVLKVYEVERGGQATWHGPGQVIVYPIVKLADSAHDLHGWMRALEEGVILALADLGLEAGRRVAATGVWVDGLRKICSIGVAASRWVTWHGLALNHTPDLRHFRSIAPCGFDANVMTSMQRECARLDPPITCESREAVVEALIGRLGGVIEPFREAAR
ncbi:MAG: lipoyl(octanoyl) transferase LipB [Planctomycetota bacterium]|jgi:lipoate-protein ligase B